MPELAILHLRMCTHVLIHPWTVHSRALRSSDGL